MGRYVPTDLKQLNKALNELLKIDPTVKDSEFVDFGCGKGRVLIVAERLGFKKVTGVEFSKTLYQICVENLNTVQSRATVVCEDAVRFLLSADMRVFYFYNSFDFCIFDQVASNIKSLLKKSQKTGYIVYVDPRQFGCLQGPEYQLMFEDNGPKNPFHIYQVQGR